MKSVLLVAVLLAAIALGAQLPATQVPRGWVKVAARPNEIKMNQEYPMTLALRRRNMDKLEKLFWEVSDPRHENYANHLKHEEVREIITPGAKALSTVTAWLRANGISKYEIARHEDSIAFTATAAQIEQLLNVKFAVYENEKTKQRLAKALGAMTVPDAVAPVVEIVAGHRGFPLPSFQKKQAAKKRAAAQQRPLGSPETNVTPALLYSVYNMSMFPATPAGQTNIQSFFQAQGQFVDPQDLQTFCSTLVPALGNCSITKYVGTNNGAPGEAGIESSLDSEYITATGRGTETWVYSYMNFDFCGDLIRWGQDVFSENNGTHPWVISMSYGAQALPNFCLGPDVDRLSKDIMKMGAMGITVVIASGDNGSGEDSRMGYNYGLLGASMPASIPYCTSVGSTTFINGNSGPQMATADFGSGGGFSFDYAMPPYQVEAAAAFFAQNYKLPPYLSYNGSGRGTPDVSALGDDFFIISNGGWEGVSGTSCSTPTFAGMVTSLNNIRLQAGKTLGFLNPFIYQNPQGFTDITSGNNDVNADGMGWYCTKGWDPVSGLGTPNFGMLAEAVKALNARDQAKQMRK